VAAGDLLDHALKARVDEEAVEVAIYRSRRFWQGLEQASHEGVAVDRRDSDGVAVDRVVDTSDVAGQSPIVVESLPMSRFDPFGRSIEKFEKALDAYALSYLEVYKGKIGTDAVIGDACETGFLDPSSAWTRLHRLAKAHGFTDREFDEA
jgi:hypothetical protein